MQVVVKVYHVLLGAILRGFLRIWMSAKQNAMKPMKAIPQGAFVGNGITKKCMSNHYILLFNQALLLGIVLKHLA